MAEKLYKSVTESGNFVFLSYKKENVDTLRKIVPHLQFNAWYDDGIHYTEPWAEAIARHIKESCAMILFLSKALLSYGDSSFPVDEFNVAVTNNRKVLVVYLEEIDDRDVPDSLTFWYEKVKKMQCLVYRSDRTNEELIREIHAAISEIAGPAVFPAHNAPVPPCGAEPAQLDMYFCSNLNDHILYAGNHDVHLSSDMRKICLYNSSGKSFEIRLMDNLNYVFTTFRQSPERLYNARIFYTPNNSYLYYFAADCIFVYDIAKGKWNGANGTKISLQKGEHIVAALTQGFGNNVFLFSQKNNYLVKLLQFGIVENKTIQAWDISSLKLQNALQHLQNQEMNIVLLGDDANDLRALDLHQMALVELPLSKIQQYYAQEENLYSDVDQTLSHDGMLYAVSTAQGLQIFDTLSHHLIDDALWGSFQDVFLLRNRVVLKYDHSGNVWHITSQGKKCLFDAAYFQKNQYFRGEIPHTLFYDEINGNYIFVTASGDGSDYMQTVVVVNSQKEVVHYSGPIHIPPSEYVCKCSIVRGELIVMFAAEKTKNQGLQNTYILKSDSYRRGCVYDQR